MTCLALACLALAGCGDGGADKTSGPTLTGLVFNDGTCDGVREPGDVRFHDINVHLYRADTLAVLATTQTDTNGNFTFHDGSLAGGVPVGIPLRVGVTLVESGMQFVDQTIGGTAIPVHTDANVGADDTIDSDASGDKNSAVLRGSIPLTPLEAGEIVDTLGIGICVVGGTKL